MRSAALTLNSYIYCEDCRMFVDFWKYDTIEDAGHKACTWRYVTDEEFKQCFHECEEDGCLDEVAA